MAGSGRQVVKRPRQRAIKGEIIVDSATRRRINRARLRRTIFVLGVIGLGAGLAGLYFSPLLRVQQVEVTGAATVSADDLRDIVGAEGESMLTVDFADAEARIGQMPQVQSVTIERQWPQTVKITVVERAPWATWAIGDAAYVIDSEGIVLGGVAAPDGSPTITATDSTGILAPGDKVDSGAVALTRALLEEVPARLQLSVASLEWSNASGLSLTTDAGYRVVVGGHEDMEYKFAVWQQIEASVGREVMNGHVLDLRFGDRPALH